jgi:hypothetical protein
MSPNTFTQENRAKEIISKKHQPRMIAPKMQLNSQPESSVGGDTSVSSFTDDEEELEDPTFPDTITASAQTSDQSAPPPYTSSESG